MQQQDPASYAFSQPFDRFVIDNLSHIGSKILLGCLSNKEKEINMDLENCLSGPFHLGWMKWVNIFQI